MDKVGAKETGAGAERRGGWSQRKKGLELKKEVAGVEWMRGWS